MYETTQFPIWDHVESLKYYESIFWPTLLADHTRAASGKIKHLLLLVVLPFARLHFIFLRLKRKKNELLYSAMFLNTLLQQKETKLNSSLNYCIFKKNHHLIVCIVCGRPSLASQPIFSPCSHYAQSGAMLKEVPCCLPKCPQSKESPLPLPSRFLFFVLGPKSLFANKRLLCNHQLSMGSGGTSPASSSSSAAHFVSARNKMTLFLPSQSRCPKSYKESWNDLPPLYEEN